MNRSGLLTGKMRRIIEALDAESQKKVNRKLKILEQKGINTYEHLMDMLPTLKPDLRSFSIWLLGRLGKRKAVPLLIDLLRNHCKEHWEVAVALALLGGNNVLLIAAQRT